MSSSPIKSIEEMGPGEPALPPVSSPGLFGAKKRPAPSLLPPFEPSSSPGLPRPLKRPAYDGPNGPTTAFSQYPTPIPTSSTGILSSSPPRVQHSRPGLARMQSAKTERVPLSTVPSIELNENGEVLFMGRSSTSSHYQLSASRHVSRVHVKARYIPAVSPLEPNTVEIECSGWNGLKLHCQGRTWDLAKGDTFTSETENADIMIDVEGARVMVLWPVKERRHSVGALSDSSWDDSPCSRTGPDRDSLESSPIRRHMRIRSPESPSRAPKSLSSSELGNAAEEVQIYEDGSDEEQDHQSSVNGADASFTQTDIVNSFSSDLSDPGEENDPDEENDPILHSFGPFGPNLSNRVGGFGTRSSRQASRVGSERTRAKTPEELEESEPEPEPLSANIDVEAIRNHVVNQLAYSRLSSNPLTAIMNNLPVEEKKELSKPELRRIIEETKCIGVIARKGKDAAGKALESEYYYIPEHDTDESRRVAVTDGLRKPSLRACRKHHKQYYWKRPKTP